LSSVPTSVEASCARTGKLNAKQVETAISAVTTDPILILSPFRF
jgi:hypothetical protein